METSSISEKHQHTIKMTDAHSSDKYKKKLTWDEHAIEEHDQLRGTRMKVCSRACLLVATCAVVIICSPGIT